MGMNHTFEFFDRAAVDHLWNISWKTLLKRNPQNAWLQSTEPVVEGSYGGKNLRELLTFGIQQSPKRIETILKTRKVSDTIRRCYLQFFTMSELMINALPHSKRFIEYVEIQYTNPLISIAWEAFISGRISTATLWSVFKLNSVKPTDLSDDSRAAQGWFRALLPWHRMWEPIYSWQGEAPFKHEESTNCLGLADTRRFISFVRRANKENWATACLNTTSAAAGTLQFKDDLDCVRLSKCMRKVGQMKKPCVHRMWR
jgi:hypothetical protein